MLMNEEDMESAETEVPERGSDSSVTPGQALEINSSSQSVKEFDSEDQKLFEVMNLVFPNATSTKSRPLPPQSESDSAWHDSPGAERWRKEIQVGSDYQAVIPEGLSEYDDAPPYQNEDRLLWDPRKLTDEEVKDFLRKSRQPKTTGEVGSVPTGSPIRDDEHALFLLQECGHNREEAMRRLLTFARLSSLKF